MRRIADVPTVVRYISIALFVLALILFWQMCRQPSIEQARIATIHVKYRAAVSASAVSYGLAARPLFNSQHRAMAAYDDPRDRWVVIAVHANETEAVLAKLARDGGDRKSTRLNSSH